MMAADRWAGGLEKAAIWLGDLTGWRRWLVAVVLGLVAGAAEPPFNLVPLLIPGFTGLVWLIDGRVRARGAALDGFLWSMGFLVPGLSWISISMTVDLDQFWWMIPITILGLPAFLSCYCAAAVAAAHWLAPAGGRRILVLAATWTLSEQLRARIPFGGFPWHLIGYAWSGDHRLLLDELQVTALVGVYGLSFVTVLAAALPARFARREWWTGVAGLLLLGLGMAWGHWRLDQHPPSDGGDGPVVRLLQTDIPNLGHYDPHAAMARLQAEAALTRRPLTAPLARPLAAVIWPESGIDFLIDREPELARALGQLAPPGGLLISGSARTLPPPPSQPESAGLADEAVANSLVVLDGTGRLAALYDKAHLVPFGEYVPMRWLLGLAPIAASRFDIATGPGPRTLELPGGGLPPVGPFICYEAIFSAQIISESNRPAWMLNVTNDAWFGKSIGPRQHFAIARVRAVEENLPLIRVANGGISGAIDAEGRQIAALPFGETGILDVVIPPAGSYSFYAAYGELPLLLVILKIIIFSMLGRYRSYYSVVR